MAACSAPAISLLGEMGGVVIKIETGRSRAEFVECERVLEIGGQHTALLPRETRTSGLC
jgi:hypothetical protein